MCAWWLWLQHIFQPNPKTTPYRTFNRLNIMYFPEVNVRIMSKNWSCKSRASRSMHWLLGGTLSQGWLKAGLCNDQLMGHDSKSSDIIDHKRRLYKTGHFTHTCSLFAKEAIKNMSLIWNQIKYWNWISKYEPEHFISAIICSYYIAENDIILLLLREAVLSILYLGIHLLALMWEGMFLSLPYSPHLWRASFFPCSLVSSELWCSIPCGLLRLLLNYLSLPPFPPLLSLMNISQARRDSSHLLPDTGQASTYHLQRR